MWWPLLMCRLHASMHCWNDSSGMPLSSITTALLMASTPHMEKYQVKRGLISLQQCLPHSWTAGYPIHPAPLLFWHAQIFGDNFSVGSFSCLAGLHYSNRQPTIAYTPPLPTRRWLQFCLLKAFPSWNHQSPTSNPLWTSCIIQKHICAKWCLLHALEETL